MKGNHVRHYPIVPVNRKDKIFILIVAMFQGREEATHKEKKISNN